MCASESGLDVFSEHIPMVTSFVRGGKRKLQHGTVTVPAVSRLVRDSGKIRELADKKFEWLNQGMLANMLN